MVGWRCRPARRRSRAPRPFLEPLEDRTLLSGGPSFAVINLNDSGPGSFRDAVAQANVAQSPATITFGVTGTISLTSGTLDLSSPMTITGPGAGSLTVTANSASGVFLDLAPGPVGISGLAISGGSAATGGAINATGGASLTIDACTFTGNTASSGGAIATNGTLTVTDSTFASNTATDPNLAQGGALYLPGGESPGQATITGCTFSGNQAVGTDTAEEADGGAIYVDGFLYLSDSTLTGNQSLCSYATGGALTVMGGTAVLTSVTLDGNNAGPIPGASGTGLGGGIFNGNSLTLDNTILAGNTVTGQDSDGPDLEGSMVSEGHNLFGDTTGVFSSFLSTDLQNVDPLLGSLADNGGPTATQLLLAGSPALGAGDREQGGSPDQRGAPRPSLIDIGAVNHQPAIHFGITINPVVQPNTAVSVTVTALDQYNDPDFFYTGTAHFTSSDGQAQLPTDYTFTPADDGTHAFNTILFRTAGAQTLTASDALNPSMEGTAAVQVVAAPPVVSVGPDAVVGMGQTLRRTGSFQDPGGGGQRALVDYGDGSGTQALSLNPDHTFDLQYTYAQEGDYQVTVAVIDGAGAVGIASFLVHVLIPGTTSVTVVHVPPGDSATASAPDVTATLFHLASAGRAASLLVADAPATLPEPGTLAVGTYDVRASNAVFGDVGIVTFHYAGLGDVPPTLRFYDRLTGRFEPVQGSAVLPNALVIDPLRHTITLILDATSFPSILLLTGTVFTISVPQAPTASTAPAAPPPMSASTPGSAGGFGGDSGPANGTAIGGSTGLTTFTLAAGIVGLTFGGYDNDPANENPLTDLPPATPSTILLPAVSIAPSQADAFEAEDVTPPAPPPPGPEALAPELLPREAPQEPPLVLRPRPGPSSPCDEQSTWDGADQRFIVALALVACDWGGLREPPDGRKRRQGSGSRPHE